MVAALCMSLRVSFSIPRAGDLESGKDESIRVVAADADDFTAGVADRGHFFDR